MSDKVKGTLAGIAFSLVAIVLWVILSFVGFIAGIAGALMGILFIIGYRAVNKNDKSKYQIIVACILIVVEIIVAELIAWAIYAGSANVPFMEALAIQEVQTSIIIDVVLGLVLSFAVFAGYLYSSSRKSKLNERRIYTGQAGQTQAGNNGFSAQPSQNTDVFGNTDRQAEVNPFENAQNEPQSDTVVSPPEDNS